MIEYLPMYLKLPETTSSRESLGWGLADGDDLPFLISSATTRKQGRGSYSRFAQRPPTQKHVSRFPAAGTTTTMILDVIWA